MVSWLMETNTHTQEQKADLNLRNVWLDGAALVHLEQQVFMATNSIPVLDYNSFYQMIKTL